jgi:hypothetical protein
MNKLIIEGTKVSIDSDIIYKAIEIGFRGELYIKSLLPTDFLVSKGFNKLIILRFNKGVDVYEDLFEFESSCNIAYAKIVDANLIEHNLLIDKIANVSWGAMGTKIDINGNKTTQTWDRITTNWNLLRSPNKSNVERFSVIKDYDAETNTTTRTKTSIKEKFTLHKKDRNIGVLGNQATNGKEYRIKGKKATYNGLYHVYTDTLKVMTGATPDKTSKELIRIKDDNGSDETRYGDVIGNLRHYRK